MLHKDERTNRRLFSCPWKMRNVRKIESLTLAQWSQGFYAVVFEFFVRLRFHEKFSKFMTERLEIIL